MKLLCYLPMLLLAGVASAEVVPWRDDAGWAIERGEWRVHLGRLVQSDAGAERTAIWRTGPAYADVDVSVTFRVSPDGSGVQAPGLVFRASSAEEYYYIHYDLRNQQVVWVRSTPANEWTDARRHKCFDLRGGTWHTGRVVARGSEHRVFLDGKLLFAERDETIRSGIVGLRTGQGRVTFGRLRVEGVKARLARPFQVPVPAIRTVCADAGAGAYEAFPDVCRTKSGDLLCVLYAGWGHISLPGRALPRGARIAVVRSRDNGRTWSPAQTLLDSPVDDRDPSIAQLSDGRLVVTYFDYVPGRKPAENEVYLAWSSDGGRTWGAPQPVETPLHGYEAVSEPVRELPDGTLLLPLYGALEPGGQSVVLVLISRDGGKTWPEHAIVRREGEELYEPSVVRLADGRLLMAIRPRMLACTSADGGRTWTRPEPMPTAGDAPYLLLTSRGVLLCAFRHPPTASTCLICSTDSGRTWSDRIVLDRVMGAYPSLVELPDGRVLVAYYTEGEGSDIRCLFLRADKEGVRVLPNEGRRPTLAR